MKKLIEALTEAKKLNITTRFGGDNPFTGEIVYTLSRPDCSAIEMSITTSRFGMIEANLWDNRTGENLPIEGFDMNAMGAAEFDPADFNKLAALLEAFAAAILPARDASEDFDYYDPDYCEFPEGECNPGERQYGQWDASMDTGRIF